MRWLLGALVLAVVMWSPASGQNDTLRIRFIGNAAFELTDGETMLVTDLPYQPGAFGYMTYADTALASRAVTAIITHGHADHFDLNRFLATDWRLVGPADVLRTVSPDRRVSGPAPWTIGNFAVRPFETPHANVGHYSYLIEWRGRRMYFTGDTEGSGPLVDAGDLDVAFVTPWLLCTLQANRQQVSARRVVLHHQFPDGRSEVCGEPVILAQGETLIVTAR